MADPSSLSDAAKSLAKAIEEQICVARPETHGGKDGEGNQRSAKLRRELFGELAKLRNSAEAAGAAETMQTLDDQRSKLRIAKKAQTPMDKVSMYLRIILTIVMAFWGSFCILLLVPLRLLHPMLQELGVPKGRLPMDMLVTLWATAVLAAAGVKVKIDGPSEWRDKIDLVGVIIYNHTSNLDPFIIHVVCSLHAPKYIGKKVLFKLPIVGWFSWIVMGNVPINRGDREKAVHTMNEAVAGVMKKGGRSVAISPEGTRTVDGHLRLPFKKGVFHLQEKTSVPLLPIVIQGAFELWPPGRVFTAPGEVTVSFLPPQYPVEASKELPSRDATRVALQQGYSEFLSKDPVEEQAGMLSWMDVASNAGCLVVSSSFYWAIWWLIASSTRYLGLGSLSIAFLLVATTIIVAFYVSKFL